VATCKLLLSDVFICLFFRQELGTVDVQQGERTARGHQHQEIRISHRANASGGRQVAGKNSKRLKYITNWKLLFSDRYYW